MAKSPNYGFEKRERERAKALKAAERATAKREQRNTAEGGPEDASEARTPPKP